MISSGVRMGLSFSHLLGSEAKDEAESEDAAEQEEPRLQGFLFELGILAPGRIFFNTDLCALSVIAHGG